MNHEDWAEFNARKQRHLTGQLPPRAKFFGTIPPADIAKAWVEQEEEKKAQEKARELAAIEARRLEDERWKKNIMEVFCDLVPKLNLLNPFKRASEPAETLIDKDMAIELANEYGERHLAAFDRPGENDWLKPARNKRKYKYETLRQILEQRNGKPREADRGASNIRDIDTAKNQATFTDSLRYLSGKK